MCAEAEDLLATVICTCGLGGMLVHICKKWRDLGRICIVPAVQAPSLANESEIGDRISGCRCVRSGWRRSSILALLPRVACVFRSRLCSCDLPSSIFISYIFQPRRVVVREGVIGFAIGHVKEAATFVFAKNLIEFEATEFNREIPYSKGKQSHIS